MNFLTGELIGKRLEFMQMLVPSLKSVAVLIYSTNAERADSQIAEVEAIGRLLGIHTEVFKVETAADLQVVFDKIATKKPDALLVAPDPFFVAEGVRLAQLASRYALPASYTDRANVEVGGLMSYGANINDAYREVGIFASRVLKGEKPAEMPVVLPTKYELVINIKAANSLGLKIPPVLQQIADDLLD